MNMQQNVNIREYLNQDIRNGKLVIFFSSLPVKNGEKQTKSIDHIKIYFTQGLFLAEVVWLSGMF